MKTFDDFLEEQLQDPEFREEYESLEPLYAMKRQLIQYRIDHNLTQAQLAERLGMKQSALARLESGQTVPTLRTLQRIARGLEKKLVVTFQ
ncbi:MAG: helix-turn-helix transcriptional regulator [Planctomycetia bacterium]|nr:helix-turn-helix transcriptional regulator [Planctomycetia bacterium]